MGRWRRASIPAFLQSACRERVRLAACSFAKNYVTLTAYQDRSARGGRVTGHEPRPVRYQFLAAKQ